MWTADDLKRAAHRRGEHLPLAPDVERVILAAERALGRTEEVLRLDAAKAHLRSLLAALDKGKVPDHVRLLYPVIPAPRANVPSMTPVPMPPPLPSTPTPQQTSPAGFDRDALVAEMKLAQGDARIATDGRVPERTVSLEPQKGKGRQHTGPSR